MEPAEKIGMAGSIVREALAEKGKGGVLVAYQDEPGAKPLILLAATSRQVAAKLAKDLLARLEQAGG